MYRGERQYLKIKKFALPTLLLYKKKPTLKQHICRYIYINIWSKQAITKIIKNFGIISILTIIYNAIGTGSLNHLTFYKHTNLYTYICILNNYITFCGKFIFVEKCM